MARDDVLSLVGGNFYVGLSAVIGFTALSYQNNVFFTVVGAGSSGCFIGGSSLAVGLAGITAGYMGSTGQIISLPLSGPIYFSSAGSTSSISYLIGLSQTAGATVL